MHPHTLPDPLDRQFMPALKFVQAPAQRSFLQQSSFAHTLGQSSAAISLLFRFLEAQISTAFIGGAHKRNMRLTKTEIFK